MYKLNAIDTWVIVAYAVLCLFIAFRYIGKIRNIQEYALGGSFPTKVLAATIFATFTGAGPILGCIERIHEVGMIFALATAFEPLAWITTAKIFSRNIEYFKSKGCLSISDIMDVLYGNVGKWTSNILSIALSVGVLAIQIKALGYISEYFLGLPEYQGATIGFIIVVAYSFFGGIRAVVFTDVLQSLVFLVGIPAACFTAYYALGGYTELLNNIPANHKTFDVSQDNMILLASCLFFALIPFSELAYIQRFLIAKNTEQLKKAVFYTFLIAVPFYIIIILTGFVTLATLPEYQSKLAFYELITNNLPVGIRGLVIAGILAAIMSTADSFLNSTSVMFAHNIVKPLYPKMSAKVELALAKFATLFFSLLGLIMAFSGDSLIKIIWLSENFWAPFIVVPLVAGFFKFYTNSASFIASLFTALSFLFLGRYIAGDFGIVSASFGLIGSAIGLFGFHKLQGKKIFTSAENTIPLSTKSSIWKNLSLSKLHAVMIRDAQSKTHQYYYFGIFGMLFFLFSSLAFNFSDHEVQHSVMWLRVLALFICTLLSLNELIQSRNFQQKWMPVLWNVALMYCLPFVSVYTLLVSNMDFAWIANLIISMVLLSLLTTGIITLLSITIGSTLAYLYFMFMGECTSAHLDNNFTQMLIALYGVGAAVILYLLNKREQEHASAITTKLLYSSLIAHEAKSPLSSIYMIADSVSKMLEDKKELSEEDKEIAEILPQLKQISKRSIRNIERTLNNLRSDISDAEDFAVYKISDCIKEAVEEFGMSNADLKRITIHYEHGFRFLGSKHFVKLIIVNLISNFFKYAGKNATLEISMRNRCVYVKDNGIGMDDEQKSKIFLPFDKGGSIHGTGVGLAFCDHAMRDMKGSIDVASEKNKGTMFTLKFPKI